MTEVATPACRANTVYDLHVPGMPGCQQCLPADVRRRTAVRDDALDHRASKRTKAAHHEFRRGAKHVAIEQLHADAAGTAPPGVTPLVKSRKDGIVPAGGMYENRDRLRRVLQIIVQADNRVSDGRPKADKQGGVLSAVAFQCDHANLLVT